MGAAPDLPQYGRHPRDPDWQPRERAVLLFLLRPGEILLIRKKRGLGAGKINGPGGRIEPGETAEEAAIRETHEEVGLLARNLTEAGCLHFQFTDGHSIHCTVFSSHEWEGRWIETDEAVPLWTPLDRIPLEEMWPDDRYWIPLLLRGIPFQGWFVLEGEELLEYQVEQYARIGLPHSA